MSFLAFVPRPAAGFRVETLKGEVVLLHLARNLILHANPTAALIWSLCDGQRSVAEIVDLLRAAYPESAEEIARDAPKIMELLLQQGALTVA